MYYCTSHSEKMACNRRAPYCFETTPSEATPRACSEQRRLSLRCPDTSRAPASWVPTISFHNFKSRNFKLSVSNPKSKYVVYSSVLSQISNCQGLGRKNAHDILKTDRSLMGTQSSRVTSISVLQSVSISWKRWQGKD